MITTAQIQKPISREILSEKLGISRTTLYRCLKKKKIDIPKGLIYPKTQELIMKEIGYI